MPHFLVDLPEDMTVSCRDYLFRQGVSRNLWKKIKRAPFTVNDVRVNPAQTMLSRGDVIRYETPTASPQIAAENLPLDVRYEDEWLLIVNKPAGQLVHPTVTDHGGTLANAVMYHYAANGESHAFHPVFRLDRQTSGLILIAKEPQIQYQLMQEHGKQIERRYLALIPGRLTPTSGLIDAPIARALPSIILRKVSLDGKPARTHYRTLAYYPPVDVSDAFDTSIPVSSKQNTLSFNGASLLELTLDTGRTHQIRVHLAHLGCPLFGDDLYGGSCTELSRQALHAYSLTFTHPVRNFQIHITVPLPDDMLCFVRKYTTKLRFLRR